MGNAPDNYIVLYIEVYSISSSSIYSREVALGARARHPKKTLLDDWYMSRSSIVVRMLGLSARGAVREHIARRSPSSLLPSFHRGVSLLAARLCLLPTSSFSLLVSWPRLHKREMTGRESSTPRPKSDDCRVIPPAECC